MGKAWLDELLCGHPDQRKEQLGVSKHVFSYLSSKLQQCCGLHDSQNGVTADEQLAIFLHLVTTGNSECLRKGFNKVEIQSVGIATTSSNVMTEPCTRVRY
jgi:hypothetical protein